MIQALLGPIANLAGTWLEGKVETKKAETGAKVAKAKAEAVIMEKKATGEIDWDLKMADASASSWKDEWLTILFSVPLILAFCGDWGRQIVQEGFTALQAMPEPLRTRPATAPSLSMRSGDSLWARVLRRASST